MTRRSADQADTVRVRFRELEIELEDGGRAGGFTLSAGIAQLSTLSRDDHHGDLRSRLLENADAALYAAKEAGGNRIRIS